MIKPFSKFLFTIILFLVFPMVSFAQVVINEIAWMGTAAETNGSYCEWIELYNTGNTEISLANWILKIGTTEKTFSADNNAALSVGAGDFYLIERYTPSACPDPVPGIIADWSVSFGTGISNSGTIISLQNSQEGEVNRVDMSGGWTAGDIATKETAQLTTSKSWITASPTPDAINVVVSNNTSNNSNSNNQIISGEVLGVSNNSSASNIASSGGGATEKVSTLNAQLEILAGNDRSTSPGSPIWFQATMKKNTTGTSPELNWSFGDGNVGIGPLVSHTYKYPGDYVVILSTEAGNIFSVSRLKVKVLQSDIVVSDEGEYLEILNKGNAEVNLFNWKLENKGKGFIFQPNTIILSHSSIKLDKSLLTMKGYDNSLGTSLKNSLKEEVFAIAPIKYIDLNEASKNLETIKKEAFAIREKAKDLGFISQSNNLNTQPANVFSAVSVNKDSGDQINTSMENIIYEAPKETSTLNKFFRFLINLFR